MTGIYISSTPGYAVPHSGSCRWVKTGRCYLPGIHHYRYFHACRIEGCGSRRTALVQIPEVRKTETCQSLGGTSYTRKWMCAPPPEYCVCQITAADWGADPRTGHRTQLVYAWREPR